MKYEWRKVGFYRDQQTLMVNINPKMPKNYSKMEEVYLYAFKSIREKGMNEIICCPIDVNLHRDDKIGDHLHPFLRALHEDGQSNPTKPLCVFYMPMQRHYSLFKRALDGFTPLPTAITIYRPPPAYVTQGLEMTKITEGILAGTTRQDLSKFEYVPSDPRYDMTKKLYDTLLHDKLITPVGLDSLDASRLKRVNIGNRVTNAYKIGHCWLLFVVGDVETFTGTAYVEDMDPDGELETITVTGNYSHSEPPVEKGDVIKRGDAFFMHYFSSSSGKIFAAGPNPNDRRDAKFYTTLAKTYESIMDLLADEDFRYDIACGLISYRHNVDYPTVYFATVVFEIMKGLSTANGKIRFHLCFPTADMANYMANGTGRITDFVRPIMEEPPEMHQFSYQIGELTRWGYATIYAVLSPQEVQILLKGSVAPTGPSTGMVRRARTAKQEWQGAIKSIHARITTNAGIETLSGDLVMRSPGRYDMQIPYDVDKPIKEALERRQITDILTKLCPKGKYHARNIMLCVPGATQQPLHTDTDINNWDKVQYYTVLIPLTEQTKETGGTRVWHSSHLQPDKSMKYWESREPLDMVDGHLGVGDALVFDGRLVHTGMANVSEDTERYFYYASFSNGHDINAAITAPE